MSQLAGGPEERLYERVAAILDDARARVARTVNTAMVHAYFRIGREIVETEQHGKERAGYGEAVIERLAAKLSRRFGKGFSAPNLRNMRQFFLTFPDGSAVPDELGGPPKRSALPSESGMAPGRENRSALPSESVAEPMFPPNLGWTHYAILMRVANPAARSFYEIEAVREAWSTRALERQIGALLFERLAASRDQEGVLALARRGQEVAVPADVIKDPFVLEFLDLREPTAALPRRSSGTRSRRASGAGGRVRSPGERRGSSSTGPPSASGSVRSSKRGARRRAARRTDGTGRSSASPRSSSSSSLRCLSRRCPTPLSSIAPARRSSRSATRSRDCSLQTAAPARPRPPRSPT
jgi:hypothetical protein